MRIAIDARLNAYRRGGIPQYTRQLLTALSEIAIEEQFISLQHRDMLRPLAVASNVTRRTIYTPPHHRFERWTLPFEVALVRPDVLHFPDFIAPTYRPCPAVVTIHDLAFMHYPQILDDAARAFYQQVLTNTHTADAVIAVSEATRQDIVQFLDVPVDDIKVIYEAAAPLFRRMDLRAGEARVLNGKPVAAGTFMLFVSTLEPRKNLPTLLQALRICIDRHPERPYKLVIVGGRGWNDEPIFAAIRDLELADYVLLAGSVGQYDLRWLYNACQFYINPSLYEGFGLPLLEAMACGAACLAAATSSLPEIAGDAALYVPPLEPDQWADAMETLWDDTERQQELGRIGQARSQRFSWTRAARETLQIYHHAAERRGQPLAPRIPAAMPARRTAQPPQPAVVLPSAVPFDNNVRTCLRCNTPMTPGELQQHLRIQLAGEDGSETPVQPRAWACPNCGYAELVVEPMVVPFASAVAATLDDSTEGTVNLVDHADGAPAIALEDRTDLPVEEVHRTARTVVPPMDDADSDVRESDVDISVPMALDPAEAADTDESHAGADAEFAVHDVAAEDDRMRDAEDDNYSVIMDEVDEPVPVLDEPDVMAEGQESGAEAQTMAEDKSIGRDTALLPALDRNEGESASTVDSAMVTKDQDADFEAQTMAEDQAPDEPMAADAPVGRDTAILPALDRDEDAVPPPTENRERSSHETAVLPAIERDTPVPFTSEDEAGAECQHTQASDMADDGPRNSGEDERSSESTPRDVPHTQHAIPSHSSLEFVPLENTPVTGVLRDAGRASSIHMNGQHPTHSTDIARAKHSKRSTASAKISRASHRQSSNARTSDRSDIDTPRNKSRSRRKK